MAKKSKKLKSYIELNRLWVHESQVYWPSVQDHFTLDMGDDYSSDDGYLDDEGMSTIIEMFGRKGKMVGLPIARPDLIEDCLHNVNLYKKAKDLRVGDIPLKNKIKVQWELRKYQGPAVDALVKIRRGILESGPRTGKTLMSIAAACRMNVTTLILAHQGDLLDQFLDTFKKATDFDQENPNVGICNKIEDFEKYDICLATYQMFLPHNGGKKRLKKIRNKFSLVIVDECHRAPATGYMYVLNSLNYQYFIGLSATPDRKDGLMPVFTHGACGPVIHQCEADMLAPKLLIHMTGVHTHHKKWDVAYERFLQKQDRRNRQIVKHVIRDLKNGHHIVIPVKFTDQANDLVEQISQAWHDDGGELPIAKAYNGQVPKNKREAVLDELRDGKYKVTVAQRSMLTGINVPIWSCIYYMMPMSNIPNYTQEVTRVCTPMDGKKKPIIRLFIDEGSNFGLRAFSVIYNVLKPNPWTVPAKNKTIPLKTTKPPMTRAKIGEIYSLLGNTRKQGSAMYDDADGTPYRVNNDRNKSKPKEKKSPLVKGKPNGLFSF